MSWSLCAALTVLSLVLGTPAVQDPHTGAHPEGFRGSVFNQTDAGPPKLAGHNMSVTELVPGHYPASRAAAVAQHYLNTQHGSPYRWLQVERVLSATLQEMAEKGRKYNLTFTVKDMVANVSAGQCTSEVLFPPNEEQPPVFLAPPSQAPPQVHCSCDKLLKTNTTEQEQTLYQRLKSNFTSMVSGQYIPDSYGFIAPEMTPLWHLAGVASSFVMLNASNENTLYNLAQVANVTQMESQNDALMFQYTVLLHELVSQEIIPWKLQVSWCPAEGVKVLSAEWQPKCDHCEESPTNTTSPTPPPQHHPDITPTPTTEHP
ncbi:hypothetical protein GJAV_G00053440 [Gymnothorax javanicus]|nr:hypothetical protein GJAV_G00053440 [Gymnothorax javanicus]